MKYIVLSFVLAIIGCEEQRISACGYACIQSNSVMVSYSSTEGCRCINPTCSDAGVR